MQRLGRRAPRDEADALDRSGDAIKRTSVAATVDACPAWLAKFKTCDDIAFGFEQRAPARQNGMPERRRVQRTRVFKSAKIFSGQSIRDCVVRDISTLGACLSLISTAYIPDTFDLSFDAGRTLRSCRTAWRTGSQIGVEFYDASFRPASSSAAATIRFKHERLD